MNIISNNDRVSVRSLGGLDEVCVRGIDARGMLMLSYAEFVSHDIKAPLAWVRGYLTLLKQGDASSDKSNAYIDGAMAGVSMIEDAITDYMALVGPCLIAPPVLVDPVPLVEDVFWKIAHLRKDAATRLALGRLPLLRIPRALLARVFFNLIYNAFVHGSSAPDRVIEIGIDGASDEAAIFIRYNGCCFPVEVERVVFDRAAAEVFSRSAEGVGLDFSLIMDVLTAYGIKMWARSLREEGVTFYLVLDGKV